MEFRNLPQRTLGALLIAGAALLVAPSLRADIVCTPRVIEFGDRGHNERPSATLKLRNTGERPVRIHSIKPSCGCIGIQPPALPRAVPPGGTAEIEVSMGSGRAIGRLHKSILITTDDPGRPSINVSVQMRVFDGLSMEPRDLKYDGVVGGDPVTKTIDLKWDERRGGPGKLAVSIVGVLSGSRSKRPSPHFRGKVVDIPGGKRIELTLLPTHPEGRVWAQLEAKLNGKSLVAPVTGNMFRWIRVVPTYFNFSRVAEDEPESFVEEVVLSSTDSTEFQVLSMTPTFRRANPEGMRLELSLEGTRIRESALRHVIRARIVLPEDSGEDEPSDAAAARGGFSGTVEVTTDHPEKKEIGLSFFGFLAPPREQNAERIPAGKKK